METDKCKATQPPQEIETGDRQQMEMPKRTRGRPPLDSDAAMSAMDRAYHDIRKNGRVFRRGGPGRKPTYCLRYRIACRETGRTHYMCIALGNDEDLISFANHLTAKREGTPAQQEYLAAKNSARQLLVDRLEARLMGSISDGPRRLRQSVRRAFRDYCIEEHSPSVEDFVKYYYTALDLCPRPRGRPRRDSPPRERCPY